MKVIYIHQYFRIPQEGGGVRSYHLAKGMVDAGIEVEMITGGNSEVYDQRWIDGIRVHYLPVSYNQGFGFVKRVFAFLKFVRKAKRLLPKLGRPDLLYISSTPLTTGLIGLWAKRKLALPYIFEVRDLWPEAPVQVGVVRNFLLKNYLYRLEAKIYRNALSIVALSPGIAEYVRKVDSRFQVSMIPNFSDLERFYPQAKDPKLSKKYGLENTLTIAYTGAIGQVNAVEELLDLAEMSMRKGKNWQFLIMGEGSHAEILRKSAQKRGLDRVKFLPFGSKEKVSEVLGLTDFAWISFAHFPVLKTNSPNKFFDALASGKAILVNHKGWVYQLVKEHYLGISCLPGKMPQALEMLEYLESNPLEIQKMQAYSRHLAETHFNKELAVRRLLHLLNPGKYPPTAGDEVYILTA